MKFIFHIIVFFLGAAVGIWWGVNHPSEAQNIHDREQQQAAKIQAEVSQAKVNLLQRFIGSSTSQPDKNSAEFKQMLSDEQQKLDDAKSKLTN